MKDEGELAMMLSELVQIINGRIKVYERAMEDLQRAKGNDSVRALMDRIPESKVLRNELITSVTQMAGTRDVGTQEMIFPDKYPGGAVLEVCEDVELTAIRAYDKALARRAVWPEDIFVMLARHRYILKIAHDVISSYRNTLAHQNM